MRPLSDPIAVKAEASRLLGELLGANRVVYFEVRGGDYVVERDYTNAAPSIVGHHPVVSFGPEMLATYRAGQTACDSDVRAQEVLTAVGRRILVVDDNTDSADLLLVLLERLGNEVRAAYDGEAGVLEAAEFGPDVVFCDIGMPKMNGYEVARRLREQPWSRELVLVALTGWGQEDDRKKSAAAGFDFHLVKPVEPAALKQLLAGLAQTSTGLASSRIGSNELDAERPR
jgi:CheY-like chemotaxis protein